ncbi:N-terminal domain of NEFA-interacting nuclear protein NIP30-domain-containing protein [Xylaria digitata]|nr:N-terminal domain of NEFA-interacting nuclear protein NIP30-domain-containing protein [Xylaria digitata]
MASRFVSGGTIAGDDGGAGEGTREGASKASGAGKEGVSVEWEAVQKDLDEQRRRLASARKRDVEGGAGGERSLYEVLQANKAAKQAAFEEQNRIRNQFRALDDDEIEFLHGVNDEQRAEEERVRRETEERLASFRKAQRGGDAAGVDVDGGGNEGGVVEDWGTALGKKRKREKGKEKGVLKGVKRRTSIPQEERKEERKEDVIPASGNDQVNSTHTKLTSTSTNPDSVTAKKIPTATPTQAVDPTSTSKPKPALGLVDYGSDEDGDD